MGAKLAAPDKFAVNFMGDGTFGMTGLDFETAVRSNIPILTVVLNNSMMAGEDTGSPTSNRLYRTADLSGNYADMATLARHLGLRELVDHHLDLGGAPDGRTLGTRC